MRVPQFLFDVTAIFCIFAARIATRGCGVIGSRVRLRI